MSGMDRLTDGQLEVEAEYGGGLPRKMALELLAHRRASKAAPAPSDGLREAWIAGRDAAAADVAQFGKLFLGNGDDVTEDVLGDIRSLTPPATLSASPAQEGGE